MEQILTKTRDSISDIFTSQRNLRWLWIIIGVIAAITKLSPSRHNNYLIFEGSFWHTIEKLPLYAEYPAEYSDVSHYGPFFSLIIAPFALAPGWLGMILWCAALAYLLVKAIEYLPIENRGRVLIYLFCAHELLIALFMQQFNVATAALIIITFAAIEKKKDWLAALVIIIGVFVKLYGIVGFAFFFFSKDKLKLIMWSIIWAVAAFILPMFISSPEYICSQYIAWYEELVVKNQGNLFAMYQNISLLGMIRKISGNASYSDIYPIAAGLILFALPYLRIKQYKNFSFRLTLLASVLMFVVLFSTGSESSTYIITLCGVAIWYYAAPWTRSRTDISLMIFAFVLTSLSPSDLFPKSIRMTYIIPYALKALPCALIWFKLVYEMCFKDYAQKEIKN